MGRHDPALSDVRPARCQLRKAVGDSSGQRRLSFLAPAAAVKFSPIFLTNAARGWVDPARWDDGIPAALVNYSVSGANNRDKKAAAAAETRSTLIYAPVLISVLAIA